KIRGVSIAGKGSTSPEYASLSQAAYKRKKGTAKDLRRLKNRGQYRNDEKSYACTTEIQS
ncbi:hypothetical protein, partial [Sphingobacterium multivorum]|uniref:hypothetical protein n=1 Tax=Sphingobacterium multivorum TaxID=28454 RepID=UPI0028A8D12D